MDVQEAWDRLRKLRELDFEAQSRSTTHTGWNGRGRGTVQVEEVDALTMLFHENGTWSPEGSRELAFNNVFRWTRDPDGRLIRLEHLRFGLGNPVYLFELVPESQRILTSAEPHVCREDLYSARMEVGDATVQLGWSITGPRKDEKITYTYR